MSKRRRPLELDEPLRHRDHSKPRTRRDFLRQGFVSGSAVAMSSGLAGLFSPKMSWAGVSQDLSELAGQIQCTLKNGSGGALPFICFDLAGGANFAASNVLVGDRNPDTDEGDQMETLSTAGYSKMGLPGDMVPNAPDPNGTLQGLMQNPISNNDNMTFVNGDLGLKFHADSPMLRGILEKFPSLPGDPTGIIDGAVIAARSDNDTGNNPHNPMYAIAQAAGYSGGIFTGYGGGVVTLVGSRNSESGGNSMAPASFIDPEIRPTKVDRASDVTGMVDVSDLTATMGAADVKAAMEAIARISSKKIQHNSPIPGISPSEDTKIRELLQCGYLQTAHITDTFAGRVVDPTQDPIIQSIFPGTEINDREFQKTASVMKMVLEGHAVAGCVTMGGYDYHTGDRATGERRDLRVGRCIGACLEYASQIEDPQNPGQFGVPLMIYVFSDGSVASNGRIDTSADGRNKGEWTGDNSSTACSFFLYYNPRGGIQLIKPGRQIGHFNAGGSVVTSSSPAANNVNLLVNTIVANYMSVNGNLNSFSSLVPNHGLGDFNNWIAMGQS